MGTNFCPARYRVTILCAAAKKINERAAVDATYGLIKI